MCAKKMRRIVFTVGGKGGVGKSWVIGLLIQWLRSQGIGIAIVDCDDETSTTSRFFGEAKFVAIRNATEIDGIVQLALEGPADVVVVDLPARAGEEFAAWFQLMPWSELAKVGIQFTALAVIAGTKDSIEAALRWREFLQDNSTFLVVLNQRDDLSIYQTSKTRQAFLTANLPECSVPKLDELLSGALDSSSWTISHALESKEANKLTQLMSRARLHRYLTQVFSQFETVRSHLLP